MIRFERFTLANGFNVIVHEDDSSPLVALNVLFRAGSIYDPPGRSGLAHLFEHLMFSGTEQVPDYDVPVQMAGGENNAFTNADFASYFCYSPRQNLETLLWLEADRLEALKVSEKSLAIQKQVVIEEYFETCLNIPFGDVWHHILPAVYNGHPYHWPTIGRNEREIGSISLEDVNKFSRQYYHPGNSIISLAGNVKADEALRLIEKWFGEVQHGGERAAPLPYDFLEYKSEHLEISQGVPAKTFYMIFPMSARTDANYYVFDLISDILASGRSALLFSTLIKDKALLSQVDAYITGTNESGLFVIEGQLLPGVEFNQVYPIVWDEVNKIQNGFVDKTLFEKLINTVETNLAISESSVLHKVMSLAYFEALGDADLINTEIDRYKQVTVDDLSQTLQEYINPGRCTTLEYHPA